MSTRPKHPSPNTSANRNKPFAAGSDKGYLISGTVVHGNHLGRTLGFPTANIQPSSGDPLTIPNGVYLVSVSIEGKKLSGLCSIGTRPTIGGTKVVIEVNILDFSGDVYGKEMSITVVTALRKEKKFRNLSQLVSQMELDKLKALKILSAADQYNAG